MLRIGRPQSMRFGALLRSDDTEQEPPMKRIRFSIASAGLALVACGSTPPPNDRAASSEAAIRGAREIGAEQVPQASLHLKLAEEQLAKGKSQIKDGDNKQAGYTLLRAQADAELALALAKENKTRTEAQQVIDRARSLRGPGAASAAGPNGAATTGASTGATQNQPPPPNVVQ
jgi:hypothetical protein